MSSPISFTIRGPAPIGFSIGEPRVLDFDISRFAVVREAYPAYDGPVEITPSDAVQVLSTHDHTTYTDIIINPVPSNYGLITWDGSTLTVS